MNTQMGHTSLTLGGEEIPYTPCLLDQIKLQFYPENPRIYSVVFTGEEYPSQAEIEERLQEADHVKKLVQSIEANGGLTDPIFVRDGDFLVIEGNSRLAAYRILAKRNPVKWGQIKSHLLPRDIGEDKIFSYLCQCHVIGRQDWAPYEQAGIIWRRHIKHNISPQSLSKEMGMSVTEIKRLIDVYSFMSDHGDTSVQHWSYYYEYLKSRKIQIMRELFPEMDSIIARRVKTGEIKRAEDIRDKLTQIAAVGGHIIRTFLDTPKSLESCYEKAIEKTEDFALYRTMNKFRIKIGDLDTKKSLKNMSKSNLNKCMFELNKIKQSVNSLIKIYPKA